MKNGDRIRSMSDDELAQFVTSRESKPCTHCRENHEKACGYPWCNLIKKLDVFTKWLASESEAMRY